MPTYEYVCPEGHAFEKFQKMAEKPRAKCPTCGLPATRKISGGAGLVFKGSGFYITDYGKDGKGPRTAPSEGAATAPAAESPKPAAKESAATTPAAPAPKTDKADKPAKPSKGSE